MTSSLTSFTVALILGGARSGKSNWALQLGEQFPGPRLYVATAEALDEEMAARIEGHRRERGQAWETREEPLELAEALDQAQNRYQVILVDCLTLWLSNLLHRGPSPADLEAALDGLVQVLKTLGTPVVLVSNEVGWGIVPDHPLARQFRDCAGRLHQRLSEIAHLVVLMVAGLPLVLKSPQSQGTSAWNLN